MLEGKSVPLRLALKENGSYQGMPSGIPLSGAMCARLQALRLDVRMHLRSG